MTLVVRRHADDRAESEATYSPCDAYRYTLTRIWDDAGRRFLFIMLNPSTATEIANDPTIERCERRARALGYGAMRIANIFAFRATDPRDLIRAGDPVGRANLQALAEGVTWADDVLCAWGAHGAHLDQGRATARDLAAHRAKLRTLGLTKDGHPRHPLYVSYAQTPTTWPHGDFDTYIAST